MYRRVLEITTYVGCVNACAYCPQEVNIRAYAKRSNIRQMSLDVFRRCINKLPGDVSIFFAGASEPWLNPHCMEMVKYCYGRGHRVRIYTTLVGVSAEDLRQLSQLKFEKVIIHLPSNDKKRENICLDDAYLSLVKLSQDAGIDNIEYMCVGEPAVELKSLLRMPMRVTPYETMSDFSGNLKGMIAPHRKILCGKIYCEGRNLSWNVLYPNGDVSLCCEDFGLKYVLGNLLELEYAALFKGDVFKTVKLGLLNGDMDVLCRRCEYARKSTVVSIIKNRINSLMALVRDGFGTTGS